MFLSSELSRDINAAYSLLFKPPACREELQPLPEDITFYSRVDWKSEELNNDDRKPVKVEFPLLYVRLVHSRGKICNSQQQCLLVMKTMQADMRALNFLDDVNCNFYIGVDGAVYEGRGWFVEPLRIPKYKRLAGKCLDIGFFMDKTDIRKRRKARDAAQRGARRFIQYGMDTGLISRDAQIMSHRS